MYVSPLTGLGVNLNSVTINMPPLRGSYLAGYCLLLTPRGCRCT